MLFLQTMLAKMAPVEEVGIRIAIIFNGSPLSNGNCGSGESEIRRISEQIGRSAGMLPPDRIAEIANEHFLGDDVEAVCPHAMQIN